MFVVDTAALVAGRVRLDGPEGRHAATVVRLTAGEQVVLVDGLGRRGFGTVASVPGKDSVEVDVPTVEVEPPPSPRLVVVQALPKGDRGEVAVETMTEVGVDEIVPWAAARCVTRWREGRGDKALARWRTTASAAAKQSRRSRFPEVSELATTAQVAERLRAAASGVLLHEGASEPLAGWTLPSRGTGDVQTAARPRAGGSDEAGSGGGGGRGGEVNLEVEVVVVVGPEGGLSPEELAAFTGAGATAYRLGPTVLRTSTAGTAALAVLLARTPRWG